MQARERVRASCLAHLHDIPGHGKLASKGGAARARFAENGVRTLFPMTLPLALSPSLASSLWLGMPRGRARHRARVALTNASKAARLPSALERLLIKGSGNEVDKVCNLASS